MRRGIVVLTCLLATCWIARASEPGPMSPEPSMLRLTEAEIVSMLGPEELYSGREIATLVLDLQAEAREEMRITAEEAAAAAARPLLVRLAGVEAARDSLAREVRAWRAGVILAVVAGGLLGWLLGSLR